MKGLFADVEIPRSELGDCGGAEGTVCHGKDRGADVLGICRRARDGQIFCAVDLRSQEQAYIRRETLRVRARDEMIAILLVAAVVGVVLLGTILFLRRRRRPPEPGP